PHGASVVAMPSVGSIAFICGATGKIAAAGCPYAVAGIVTVQQYCEHGVTASADGITPMVIDPSAGDAAAAAAAAAQAAQMAQAAAAAAAMQQAADAAAAAQAAAAAAAAAQMAPQTVIDPNLVPQ
ncbi:MAG: hypothetical protein K5886_12595, partial [Lachnospiraceae bacterium]|nr:hypothetical protein [Lachnospiraceae bacterium]